jgi:hypothetical protein
MIHPEVAAEQAIKRENDPLTCFSAYGFVDSTASHPRPQWCVRPKGHAGNHMNAEYFEQYKAEARDRQRKHRSR